MAADKPDDSRGKPGASERRIRMDGPHTTRTDRGAAKPPEVPAATAAESLPVSDKKAEVEAPVEIRMRSLSEIKAEGSLLEKVAVTPRESEGSGRGRGRRGVPQVAQEIDDREEQLHQQASEVAAHLRTRLRDLDGRETQLHALAAQLESDARMARLMHAEREHELAEREAAQQKREETFLAAEKRLAEIREAAGVATDASKASIETMSLRILELERQQTDIAGREQNLLARQREFDDRQKRFAQEVKEHRQRTVQFESDRSKMEEVLKSRELTLRAELEQSMVQRLIDLEAGEKLLVEQARMLDQQQQEVLQLREDLDARFRKQVRESEERQRIQMAEIDHLRRQQATREQTLVEREAELLAMRDEITELHRQSLEMRLVAEQLWCQISPRVAQETLAQSIAALRLQLVTDQKKQLDQLASQKGELLALGERVQKEFAQLEKRRQELANWHSHKQDQLEAQAQELTERESRLVQRQERLQVNISRMDAQKVSYERQILQMRLSRSKESATAGK